MVGSSEYIDYGMRMEIYGKKLIIMMINVMVYIENGMKMER